MRRIIEGLVSEKVVVAAIVLNTVSLFNLASCGTHEELGNCWFVIDYACVLYFLFEAAAKIGLDGWRGYWRSGWNRFDLLVVVASLPVLLAPWYDLEQFAVVLLLRLGRLFRLFRLLRFIPNREHLAVGISRALKASVGVFFALVLINVVLAIGATMIFGRFDVEHFGDPLMSIYTVFRVFTLEGWYEIPDAIAIAAGSPGWGLAVRAYFVLMVLLGGVLGLSLANAVFVDEMTMDNTRELERKIDDIARELTALRRQLNGDGDRGQGG